jgi:hypothetical protein
MVKSPNLTSCDGVMEDWRIERMNEPIMSIQQQYEWFAGGGGGC